MCAMGMAICPEWTDTHCRSIPADRDVECQTSAAADLPDGRRRDNTEIWRWCLAGILHHEIRAIGCAPYHGYFQCGINGGQKCIEGSTQRSIKPLLTTETGKLDFPQSLPYSSSYSSAYSSLASSSSSWSLLLALDEAAASSASLSSSRAELSDEWSES